MGMITFILTISINIKSAIYITHIYIEEFYILHNAFLLVIILYIWYNINLKNK